MKQNDRLPSNLRRRHLTESQRAQVFAAMCNYKPGRPESKGLDMETNVSQDTFNRTQAAIAANVSVPTMARAMKVDRQGDESLKKAVINGEVTVKEACTSLNHRHPKQVAMMLLRKRAAEDKA